MQIILVTFVTLSTVYSVLCIPQGQSVTGRPGGFTKIGAEEIRYLQSNKGFGPTRPSYKAVAFEEEEEEYEDNEPESSQDRYPTYANQNYPIPVTKSVQAKAYPTASPKAYIAKPRPQEQYRRAEQLEANSNKLEEEEKEEPDRLTLLLPQSRFVCSNRKTGYYADEELGCEVFHYCQDNARHSWICPEGFTFHQVHLICMPPGGDNICEKSSDYHFVNEYLYKPLNLQEHQQKPNVTLVYSDRYYPESYRHQRYDDEEDARPVHHQHSIRVTGQPRLQQIPSTTFRPQTQLKQVFRSPEEINISLQQRRPAPVQYTTSRLIDY